MRIPRSARGEAWSGRASPLSFLGHQGGRVLLLLICGVTAMAIGIAFVLFSGLRTRSIVYPIPVPNTQASSSPITSPPSAAILISKLAATNALQDPLTPALADTWKRNLRELAELHASAIPAIREFLVRNEDIVFDNDTDRQTTGCLSLRQALIEVLVSSKTREAETAACAALQRTADPREIATLAQFLERVAPGKYAQPCIDAAREALTLAATPAWDGRDVAPLFEVLKFFAGPDAVSDLQKAASTWFIYTPIVLAQLRGGSGIPALVEWTKNPNAPLMAGNEVYLRMLAEASIQDSRALETLVELARSNRIPSSAWDGMAAALSGARLQLAQSVFEAPIAPLPGTRSFHISAGNQTYLEIPPAPSLTAQDAVGRVRAIDLLLGATENPFGQQALGKARQSLTERTGR